MALEKAYLNSISTKDKEDYHIKFVDYGFDMYSVNIPESFEPPVRTFRATVPAPESR